MADQGLRYTTTLNSQQLLIDMAEGIAELEPDAAPLTVILMKSRKGTAKSFKHEWMENRPLDFWTKINNVGGYTTGDTSIVVDDASIFAANDLIRVARTDEVIRVTAVNTSTNTLTVTRGWGSTAAAINDDDWLLKIGNAMQEGSTAPTPIVKSPTFLYNYTEIFRTPVKVTKTLDQTALYGGNERNRQRAIVGRDHRKKIEYAMLFGVRNSTTVSGEPVRSMGGILSFLTKNVKDVSGAAGVLTELEFDKWTEGLFRYNERKSITLLSSARLLTAIAQWHKGKLTTRRDETTYGVTVNELVTPHGRLNIIYHPLLENQYEGWGLALDLNNIKYMPLGNRDTKLQTNIGPNDADYFLDDYLTECTLEFRLPERHGLIKGVA